MEDAGYKPCPNCLTNRHVERVRFTSWGGFFGPVLFNTVRCRNCGIEYNGRTGSTSRIGIGIYFFLTFILVLLLACLWLYFTFQ